MTSGQKVICHTARYSELCCKIQCFPRLHWAVPKVWYGFVSRNNGKKMCPYVCRTVVFFAITVLLFCNIICKYEFLFYDFVLDLFILGFKISRCIVMYGMSIFWTRMTVPYELVRTPESEFRSSHVSKFPSSEVAKFRELQASKF